MLKPISSTRKTKSILIRVLLVGCTSICGILALFMICFVLYKGLPNVTWQLLSTKPSYLKETIGILPDLLNTLWLVIASLILIVPLGVGTAIYLEEYAKNKKLISLIELASETLAGIPSIIFGLVGMLFFVQALDLQTSLLAGSLTMVIMNLPSMIRSSQESLKTVPADLKEGAYGLGAGKWKVIRSIVLPGCLPGIISGVILCIGRMVGETAALLFTAGFAHSLNNFFSAMRVSGSTLSVALYVYAKEQGNFEVAFAIAAILLILVIVINGLADFIQYRFEKGTK